jgi:hypothetical protein
MMAGLTRSAIPTFASVTPGNDDLLVLRSEAEEEARYDDGC